MKVALLFRQHHDLLEEFTYFLPDAQAPAQVLPPPVTACLSSSPARLPPACNSSLQMWKRVLIDVDRNPQLC